jgi:hypothetical protein
MMAVNPTLGTLAVVDPRTIWPREAADFTPWLLANPTSLRDALGIDIELSSAEHAIGNYSLDLIGRDVNHDAVLIVENQLGFSDHTHLGQLLTYASGSDAKTIVWITTGFKEEHRQALDWLNQSTDEHVRFFGLQIEVVRIGDALPAVTLKVVAQPNDWQKRLKTSAAEASMSGKPALYYSFWSRFLERIHKEHPGWTRARKPQTANWLWVSHPLRGIPLSGSFGWNNTLSVELYIDTQDGDYNTRLFDRLAQHRVTLENDFGRPLTWDRAEGRRFCSMADTSEGDVARTDKHDEYINWIFDSIERWKRSLAKLTPDVLAVEASAPPAAVAEDRADGVVLGAS